MYCKKRRHETFEQSDKNNKIKTRSLNTVFIATHFKQQQRKKWELNEFTDCCCFFLVIRLQKNVSQSFPGSMAIRNGQSEKGETSSQLGEKND